MYVACVYPRVSTQGQNLDRQESIIAETRDGGYYIAGVYREKHPALAPTGRSYFV